MRKTAYYFRDRSFSLLIYQIRRVDKPKKGQKQESLVRMAWKEKLTVKVTANYYGLRSGPSRKKNIKMATTIRKAPRKKEEGNGNEYVES